MNKNIVVTGILGLIASVTIGTLLPTSNAEEENVIRIVSGETIEIGTDSLAQSPQYSWILTKDRKFQNAQRNRFFQTRLAQAGTYVLDVSIQDAAGGGSEYRAFTIIVSDQTSPGDSVPQPSRDASTPLKAVLATNLPTQNGIVYLPPTGGIMRIDPSQSEGSINAYDIDVDSTIDSDRDGNPTNDKDTDGTVSEKSGTALYLFTLPRGGQRTMSLSVGNISSPTLSTTSLQLAFEPAPTGVTSTSSTTQVEPNGTSPIHMEKNGRDVRFSVDFDPERTQGKELLLLWDFGDRKKSLLTSPVHTYGSPGTYPVTLTIRDIATGEILWNGSDGVTIEDTGGTASSSVRSSEETTTQSSSAAAVETGSGGVSFVSILYVGFIILMLIALAVGMYFGIRWIKNATTSKLQTTLEKMEGTIVKKETKSDIIDAAAEPMKLQKENAKAADAIVTKELSKTEFKKQERGTPSPVASSGPVPSWLAKGQSPKTSAPETVPTTPVPAKPPAAPPPRPSVPATAVPTPAPALASVPPRPTPAASAPTPPKTTPAASTPDWLKKSPTPSAGTPAPAQPEKNSPVPDWLKKGQEKDAEVKPVAAPVTTPPREPVAPAMPVTTSPSVTPEPVKDVREPTEPVKVAAAAPPAVKEPVATPPPVSKQVKAVPPPPPAPATTAPPAALAPVATTPKSIPETVKPTIATVPQEKAVETPVTTKAEPSPPPTPAPTPVTTITKPEPIEQTPPPDADPPIAFIQADSLSK